MRMIPFLVIMSSLAICANADVGAVTERRIDEFRALTNQVDREVQADILCAATLGYLACGAMPKAKACWTSLSKLGDAAPDVYLSVFTNGTLRSACKICRADGVIERDCRRCEGKGIYEALKGTRSKCILCDGNGLQGFKCEACGGTGSVEFDRTVCASLCTYMLREIPSHAPIEKSRWETMISAAITGKDPEADQIVMGVPRKVFDSIKSKAQSRWPDDYGMQKYEIENEVGAYKSVQSMDAQ